MIRSGVASRSVHNRAWVSNSSLGSRIRTQRRGTAGKPVLYQTALAETTSTTRSFAPYQLATVMVLQAVAGSWVTTERLGKRSPLRRGLPIWCGFRGGAGPLGGAASPGGGVKVCGV